ncbi:hypothetical protein G6F58_012040 [Rhizopus delemar]|nr:hypothetical protein G6F68_008958 [Rhizopus microsporus]KAG1394918.1 hypothetical protein G6F58_012040 [Rhizopus delemar]
MSENIATESTDGSPPQSSSPDSLMAPTAQLGTMASKYAHSEATPMEEDIPPVSQKPEDIARKSLEMIKDMKKQALLLFATYMNSNKSDPDSPETLQALSLYREFEQKIVAAKEAHKSMTSLFEERQDAKDLGNNLGLVRLVVPNDLPVLQLRGETLWRKKADPFDSAYDFCNTFETVLHAHGLSLNSNWERLLPLCMNPEQVSWCREALMDKRYTWKEVRPIVLDHFDTPYRKFLLMVEVGSMRQAPYESNREYSNRFQKMRREAGMEDGTQLAVTYFASLKPSVKTVAQVAISSHLGAKLPVSINQIIDLVLASGEDSAFSIKNPHKRGRLTDEEQSSRGSLGTTSKVSSGTNKVINFVKSNNSNLNKGTNKPKPCMYCGKEWNKGHRCEEFKEAKKSSNNAKAKEGFSLSRVNRMAIRSNTNEDSENDEDVTNGHLNRMALD